MTNQTTKATLTPARRRLIDVMQRLGFGTIYDLIIHNGEPILDPSPRRVRTVKLCGENGPRPEVNREDFTLKAEVRDLFAQFDSMKNGTILLLKVQHGLPITYEVEEVAA